MFTFDDHGGRTICNACVFDEEACVRSRANFENELFSIFFGLCILGAPEKFRCSGTQYTEFLSVDLGNGIIEWHTIIT